MKIQKLNIVKKIDDKAFSHFEKQGYSELDENGKPIKKANKKAETKIAELEAAVTELTTKAEALEKAVAERDAKIAELEKAPAK